MIDDLFRDCESIAQKYESHLINVVLEFSRIEMDYKRQLTYVPYDELLQQTDLYFKNEYTKHHANIGEVK